jgi:PAS domain S-box-containing protein
MSEAGANGQRVLILAPQGRDAAVAGAILREAEVKAETCPDLKALCRELARGAGLAVVAEEALATADLHGLSAWLAAQPPWSDLPVVLLTRRGGNLERNPAALRLMALFGNVSFLERPFHPMTLVSAVAAALRARRRQYLAGEHLREREAAAATLAAAHAHTAEILECIDLAFYAVDHDWRLTYVNRHVERFWGRPREGVLGRVLWDLSPGLDVRATESYRLHVEAAQTRRPVHGEYLITGLGVWVEVSIHPSPAGLSVYLRDTSERKHAEQSLRAAKAEAERANIAKSKFLAAASHDLRQPVQSLVLFFDLLKKRVGGELHARLLGNMERALEALGMLLNSLLDVSKLDAGLIVAKPEPIPLAPLLERLAAEYRPRAEAAGLRLRVVLSTATVRSDPVLLERLLRNLLENSLQYTDRGGILIGCRRRGDRMWLGVVDTGIGIVPDKLDEVFEEFYQVGNPERDRAKGLGLGLAVVRRLARLLDHPVEVRSLPGRGSTFAVVLPLGSPPTPRACVTPQPSDDEAGTVIVIEDDLLIRIGLEAMLEEWGHTVLGAGSVDEAVLVAQHAEAPEAILADYRLQAESTGLEAIRAVHARLGRSIPAAILTGDTAPERLVEAQRGGFHLLHKPVVPAELRRTVAGMVRESRHAG